LLGASFEGVSKLWNEIIAPLAIMRSSASWFLASGGSRIRLPVATKIALQVPA
jgi:hypothetical protein